MAFDMKALAQAGARVRLNEIREERQAIIAAFPELRGGGSNVGSGRRRRQVRAASGGGGGDKPGPLSKANKPKRAMSAAARKAISEAQKRRWAKVRRASK